MRKIISVLLAAVMIAALFAFPAAADDTVVEFGDLAADGNVVVILWDWILVDGSTTKTDPVTYLEDFGAVGGPVSEVGISGWAATNKMEITALGYMIDDGAPVMSESFMKTPENAVVAAAGSVGCSYVTRYRVDVDVSALEGNHDIEFLIQFEDGTIAKMMTYGVGTPVAFEYSADGSDVTVTPAPTEEPDPSELDNAPGPIFRFNDEDLYSMFFTSQRNAIEDIYYDETNNCFVISLGNVGDPWVVMSFLSLSGEDDYYTVDADKYKVMQIGVRFNSEAGSRGQFYFQTDENAGYDEPKDVVFDYGDTNEKQYVNVMVGNNKKWTGTMADCRLDPLTASDVPCDYELYYIAFFTNVNAANEFGDKWLAEGEVEIPTPAPTPTKAPTPEPTKVTVTEAPVVTEAPAATDEPAPAATEKPADGDNTGDDNTDDEKGNKWLVPAIVAAVVVAAAVVAGIVIGKNKKKK